MRLIDADRLIEQVHDNFDEIEVYGHGETIANLCEDEINKAPTIDQWHYPSKGEYPTESGEYFVLIKGLNGSLRPFIFNYYADIKKWSFDVVPICWQYIIPPKEEA